MSRLAMLMSQLQQKAEQNQAVKTSKPFNMERILEEAAKVEAVNKELSQSRSSSTTNTNTTNTSQPRTTNTTNTSQPSSQPRTTNTSQPSSQPKTNTTNTSQPSSNNFQGSSNVNREVIRETIKDTSEPAPKSVAQRKTEIQIPTEQSEPNRFLVKEDVINDYKDTNIEKVGGKEARAAVKDASKAGHDWEIVELGQPGLWIWRIEKFEVIPWPKDLYGSFYRGDSYIVLYGYLKDDLVLAYDLHFWLGRETSQDEAGTAAYKTVELDTYLDDLPVQYREVDGQETERFLSYFPNGLIIMEGGIDSGFNKVTPEEYQPRLLHVKGKGESVSVRQVPLEIASLNSGDVFILDAGLDIYQFNGSRSSVYEKQKGRSVCEGIYNGRSGERKIHKIEEDDDDENFWGFFGGKAPIAADDVISDQEAAKEAGNELYKLSDSTGELVFEFVAKGKEVTMDKLDENDVFIVDVGYSIFVWIGNGASELERKSGMRFAQMYIERNHQGLPLPISVVRQSGCTQETYNKFFH